MHDLLSMLGEVLGPSGFASFIMENNESSKEQAVHKDEVNHIDRRHCRVQVLRPSFPVEERLASGLNLHSSSPPPPHHSLLPAPTPFKTAKVPRRVRWADQMLDKTKHSTIETRVGRHVQRARLAASESKASTSIDRTSSRLTTSSQTSSRTSSSSSSLSSSSSSGLSPSKQSHSNLFSLQAVYAK
eukprot:CAMPEP_0173091814 /NCGR_PEP_ID=MMETSP1102-20130122/28392_1 /TAXON_ID=49646 /ORGANISM="Geminigera sp., Strain Caron Lab Isolate" /LENGTH=185 /DNA_ID=CAMNT_0013978257 /DNA_START=127 /DNA_END=684 /DNA_ORIENTATION=-